MDNNKPVAERCAMTVPVDDAKGGGKFTPGPWRRSFDAVYAGTGDFVKLIAKVPHVGDLEQETIANIDLLALAPEMWDLLNESLSRVICQCLQDEGDNPDCLHHRIKALLARP